MKKKLFLFYLILNFNIKSEVFHISANSTEIKNLCTDKNKVKSLLDKIYLNEKKFSTDAFKEYYNVVADLIKKFNLKQGLEIGVLYAGNSEFILKNTNISKLYSVDPYSPEFFESNELYANLLHLKAKKRLQNFGNRSVLIRKNSVDALKLFENNSLDFVFIDGDHTYKAVKMDIENWYQKVIKGGLLIGDDYHFSLPGVIKAVDEFCKSKNLVLNNLGANKRIWYIKKQ